MLDELGVVQTHRVAYGTRSASILNTRYNDNRTTIITSNFEDEPAAESRIQMQSYPDPMRLHGRLPATKRSETASANACVPASMKCAV